MATIILCKNMFVCERKMKIWCDEKKREWVSKIKKNIECEWDKEKHSIAIQVCFNFKKETVKLYEEFIKYM